MDSILQAIGALMQAALFLLGIAIYGFAAFVVITMIYLLLSLV